jgi:O-antigen ligase
MYSRMNYSIESQHRSPSFPVICFGLLSIVFVFISISLGISTPFARLVAFAIGGILLLLMTAQLDVSLVVVLLFLMIPFTLGVQRLGQILQISNFLIIFTFLCWMVRRTLDRPKLVKTPFNVPIYVFLSLIMLAYLRNPRHPTDNTNLVHYNAAICLMLYLFTLNIVKRKGQILQIKHAYFVFYNIGLLLTLYVFFTGARVPQIVSTSFSHRYTGGGVHGVGSFSSACILFLLCQPSYIRSKWVKFLLLLGYFCAIPLSGSRGLVVRFAGTLSLFCIIKRRFGWLFALVPASIGVFLFISRYYDPLPGTVQRMFTFEASSFPYRFRLWQASWQSIKEHPIFGIGYGRTGVEQRFSDGLYSDMLLRGPHNAYIFITRSLGLVGLGIFGWMMLTSLTGAFRLEKKIQDPHVKQFVFFIAMYIVVCLMSFMTGGGETSPNVYLALGLISAIYAMNEKEGLSVSASAKIRKKMSNSAG